MSDNPAKDPLEPFSSAPDNVKKIMKRILELETEKLYEQRPRINSDIINIIKEEINEVDINTAL